MSVKKNIHEMNAAAGIQGTAADFFRQRRNRKPKRKGAPFTKPVQEQSTTVKMSRKGVVVSGKGNNKKLNPVKFENKSESMLREAIRNLIFLNRVKYHEENVKREIQEQKLRKVIRFLLKEEKSPIMLTTGENKASDYLTNIQSTTFDQLYAKLSSSKDQRSAFRETYLKRLKLYLDSLDKQHVILNPDDKPNNQQQFETPDQGNEPNQSGETPVAGELPEQPPELPENPEAPLAEAANITTLSQMGGGRNVVPDTSRLQSQVMTVQLHRTNLDSTGIEAAETALVKDLPQIDKLYSQLTFKPLQLPNGQVISDREAFRRMLFGFKGPDGQEVPGNIDRAFDDVDKSVATSDEPAATPAPTPEIPVPSGTSPGAPKQLSPRPEETEAPV